MIHRIYYYFNYISIIISVAISCYSSSLPTHISSVTLPAFCTPDFTCRFLCLDAAREVRIEGGIDTRWQSRDSKRLCDVTEHR